VRISVLSQDRQHTVTTLALLRSVRSVLKWAEGHPARSIVGGPQFSIFRVPKPKGMEYMAEKTVILVLEDQALIRLSAIGMLEDLIRNRGSGERG
jgi:hypothetical protein